MTQTSQPERSIASVSPPLPPMGGGMEGRLVIGQGSGLDALDPFPALMHDGVPPEVMFPPHTHRGVEIISYCLSGALYHEDSTGNRGTLVAGGVERNLFGRGYQHSERPAGGRVLPGLPAVHRPLARGPRDGALLAGAGAGRGAGGRPGRGAGRAWWRASSGARARPWSCATPPCTWTSRWRPGGATAIPVPPDYAGIAYVLEGRGAVRDAGGGGGAPSAPRPGRGGRPAGERRAGGGRCDSC